MSITKLQIHQHCLQELKSRLQTATEAMASLRESVASDTKSSMGDKYETAREMALVQTSKGTFYLAAPMGKIAVEGTEIMVISPQSPAGRAMLGKKKDEIIKINESEYRINSVA
jgi:transcription elongation GreA/GreB family factor